MGNSLVRRKNVQMGFVFIISSCEQLISGSLGVKT